jgi:hypothetical protein
MRPTILILTLAAIGLGRDAAAANTTATAPPKPGELLLRWRFLGQAQLAGDTNAACFRNVWALPTSQRLVQETLQKLARAPQKLCKEALVAPGTDPSALIRPLLDDLLQVESFGEGRASAGPTPEWTLAVRLDEARAARWRVNLRQVLAAFGATVPADAKAESWEAKRATTPDRFALARAGQWLVLGWGQGALPDHAEVVNRLKASGRPAVAASAAWLEVEANLPWLAKLWQWPSGVKWPQAHLTIIGKGANLRSTTRLAFAEPLRLRIEPWRIPTNTIRERVISFTGVQGVGAWLAEQPLPKQLGLEPAPNQVFGWAQKQVPFETYVAWLLPDARSKLPATAERLPGVIKANLPWLDVGEVNWDTNAAQVTWMGLPIIRPFLRPAPAPENHFLLAGIFPVSATKQAPGPPELYAQLLGRTNLVYYDWELTQNRLEDWRHLFTLYSALAAYKPPATNNPALVWLADTNMTGYLGNSITELTVNSPRELLMTRASPLGLTGFELVALGRWLDNPAFPAYVPPQKAGLRPGAAPLPRPAPPPAPKP